MRLDAVVTGLASLRAGELGFAAEEDSARAVDEAIESAEGIWKAISDMADSQVRVSSSRTPVLELRRGQNTASLAE